MTREAMPPSSPPPTGSVASPASPTPDGDPVLDPEEPGRAVDEFHSDRQAVLFSLIQSLSACSRLAEAADEIVDASALLFDWDAFSLDLYHPEKDQIEPVVSIDMVDGVRTPVTHAYALQSPSRIMQRAIGEGALLLAREAHEQGFLPGTVPYGDTDRPSATLMFAPIRLGDQVQGVVSVQSYRYHAFDERDLELLQVLADLCGGAVDRIRVAQQLVEREERYRFMFEHAPMPMWIHDSESLRILDVNEAAIAQYGLSRPRFLALTVDELRAPGATGPDPTEEARPAFVALEQCTHRAAGGRQIEVELHSHDIIDRHRAARLVIAVDITERTRDARASERQTAELERRVAERTVELSAANRELEAFSYSVSHDLRAPLRWLKSFGALLENECGDELSARARGYLSRIRTAEERMSQIIEDLLELSRVGRGPLRTARHDLARVAEQVVEQLRAVDTGRQVQVQISPGLVAQADHSLVRTALENLIGNAWKFTRGRPVGQIEVGCTTTEGQLAFYVRDNGAGFDMSQADGLFDPFRRLHSQAEFEGSGIGLAVVRRIIRRHGGRIWARSAPDRGATFFFTLPG